MLQPGDRLDRYTIEARLGRGGMGSVYRAFDDRLQRRVALKLVRAGGEGDGSAPELAARLLREARAAAALTHPNVVAIHDVGEAEGNAFIAMELVAGKTLRAWMAEPPPPATRVSWLCDVARALAAAHRAGLVHRDVKPENVIVSDEGTVKVLDFGIARRAAGAAPGDMGAALATLTADGALVGTPLYMAPEQLRSEPLDGRTDQFAWGVLAYEVLAGKPPWSPPGGLALMAAILTHDPAPLGAAAPAEVEAVVLRALRKLPGERFATMDEVVRALGAVPDPPTPEVSGMAETLPAQPSGKVPSLTECPPEAAFVELLAGRLTASESGRIERHVETCEACRGLLEVLRAGATAAAETDDDLARALLRAGATEGESALGRTLDRKYRIVALLGKGGMGEVYEAEHLETGRRVAVKLIHAHLSARGEDAASRFRREARAAGALDSPHVVEILDAGKDESTGDLYLVMPHLRGEDLQHTIDRVGPLPPEVALRIAAQALAGLAEAHAAGIVHRDLKPANLFLARREGGEVTVVLLDFGIAKVTADALPAGHTTGLTRTEGVLGSPLYMSPEQMQDSKSVDARTDLWSLGSALYCALSGRAPYKHVESLFELLPAIRAGAAPPLQQIAPWVSAEVAEAVHRAFAVDREKRYPSAGAMLRAIRALVPGDLALREEMLTGVPAEVRVVGAPPPASPSGEVTLGPASSTRAPALRSVRPGPRRLVATRAAQAVVALGLGVGVMYAVGRPTRDAPSRGVPLAASIADTTAAPEVASGAPTASSTASLPEVAVAEQMRRVNLVVRPSDASVEVDGAPAPVRDGGVEIAGKLGSVHRVRVLKGKDRVMEAEVSITESGAMPPKMDLKPRGPSPRDRRVQNMNE